jgi:hypothetical protein
MGRLEGLVVAIPQSNQYSYCDLCTWLLTK